MQQENLIFVVCSPRSGSTMLQRMLGAHPEIYTHPEPHLITPLAYLGYHGTVDKAPYDHINAAAAFREFCQELPEGEEDVLDALRAYAMTLYGRVLEGSNKTIFCDKTPEYATVLPFLAKLFPKARYVVLTRHPLAIFHSQAHSFFGGNYQSAYETNPLMQRYVKAIGEFLLEKPVDFVQVRYEDLVQEPQENMQRVLAHLGREYDEACVNYGTKKHISKSYGDPMSVEKHQRPVTKSLTTWASDLQTRPEVLGLVQQAIIEMDPAHLAAWGYPENELLAPLEQVGAQVTKRSPFNSYQLKRQVLLQVRKNIHDNVLGSTLRKVRYYCDVLLRN